MKRTDPLVRKRCRNLYGERWWDTDKLTKQKRQDDAIADIKQNTKTIGPVISTNVDADVAKLSALVIQDIPHAKLDSIVAVDTKTMRPCYDALVDSFDNKTERRWLFHGTTSDATPNIVRNGFNRSYCGRNATVYGRGVYFAHDMTYSLQSTYSPPDSKGVKTVIAARVLIGNIEKGANNIVEPGVTFHSTVDSVTNPKIFVVYKDYQAIPEYVLRFRM